jgi:hypothetical protein
MSYGMLKKMLIGGLVAVSTLGLSACEEKGTGGAGPAGYEKTRRGGADGERGGAVDPSSSSRDSARPTTPPADSAPGARANQPTSPSDPSNTANPPPSSTQDSGSPSSPRP